jgi:hypothetical protein
MPLTRRDTAFRDYAMPCGEVDRGKHVFSSRGCAEISTDGQTSTLADASNQFGAPSKSSKSFGSMCAETAEVSRISRNSERRGIASQRRTSNP